MELPSFTRDHHLLSWRRCCPDFAAVNNPLDVTGAAAEDPEILASALAAGRRPTRRRAVVFAMNVGLAGPGQEAFYRGAGGILAEVAREVETPVVLLPMTGGAARPGDRGHDVGGRSAGA